MLVQLAEFRVQSPVGEMRQEGHMPRKSGRKRRVETYRSFVRPQSRYIARSVTTSAKDEHGPVKRLCISDTVPVSANVKVEAAEAVAAKESAPHWMTMAVGL